MPEYTVLSWAGGSKAAGKVDWSVLKDKSDRIVIWPDNDEAGQKAAQVIQGKILTEGIATIDNVGIVNTQSLEFGGELYSNILPEKWDLGDELPDNLTLAGIREVIDNTISDKARMSDKNSFVNLLLKVL